MRNVSLIFLFTAFIVGSSSGNALESSGVKGGLVVCIGEDAAKQFSNDWKKESYLFQCLETSDAKVSNLRKSIQATGCYGKASAIKFDGKTLPYADNLVNLLVVGSGFNIPKTEMERVLAPNGVVSGFSEHSESDTSDKSQVSSFKKPWPKAIDEWTHFLHGPENNAVSQDELVAPPKHFQWISGPRWARSHDHLSSLSAMVSAGGRVYSIIDEAPIATVSIPSRWSLIARDAFSGVLLWKRSIGNWEDQFRDFRTGPSDLARRLVAIDDKVFVTLGYGEPVSILDGATGKTIKEIAQSKNTIEIIAKNKALYLVVGDRAPDTAPPHSFQDAAQWMHWRIYEQKPPRKHILAVDDSTGAVLWKKDDADANELLPTTLLASGNKILFENYAEIVALDAKTGKVAWRAERPVNPYRPTWSAPTLLVKDNVILSGDRSSDAPLADFKPGPGSPPHAWFVNSRGGIAPEGKIMAFSMDSGKKLWEADCKEVYNAPVDVLVANDKVWSGNLVKKNEPGISQGLDLNTGKPILNRPKDQEFFEIKMSHHRCYRNKATEKYLLLGRDGIEFIDTTTGEGFGHNWVRGSCQYGIMPANGLLYAPHHSCACHVESKLNSFNALSGAESKVEKSKVESRLVKGPAYSQVSSFKSQVSSSDWPTYRNDVQRSGKAATQLATNLKQSWAVAIPGGKLSTLVSAGGMVFVAAIESHTVYALDAATGKTIWSFVADGRVDSPPTIHNGTAIFGSADGHIYCVSAADGQLAWRFRTGPYQRSIVAYGQLESAWPLHGSTMVLNGIVHAVAGRTPYLDGGMFLYRLDAGTGELLSQTPIKDIDALPDVLAYQNDAVYMRHTRFDKDGKLETGVPPALFSPAGYLDGTWWHRTYWLSDTFMGSGYGRWPNSGQKAIAGRMLVMDGDIFYGFGRYNQYSKVGSHLGLGKIRYKFFAAKKAAPKQTAQPENAQQKKRRNKQSDATLSQEIWVREIPVLARGMLLSGKTLFIAGLPDLSTTAPAELTHPYDPSPEKSRLELKAALNGQRGGLLIAASTKDGAQLTEIKLDAPPVWDGMIAANQRLFIATMNGKVLCFSGKE